MLGGTWAPLLQSLHSPLTVSVDWLSVSIACQVLVRRPDFTPCFAASWKRSSEAAVLEAVAIATEDWIQLCEGLRPLLS